MAAGKRPVPFRTRKLSPPAPMVLPPGGSGRVGYRRPNNFTHKHPLHNTTVVQRVLFHMRWPNPPGWTSQCGQPHHHPSLAHTHQFCIRSRLRIADNTRDANNGCLPTNYVTRLRLADNHGGTNNGRQPTNPVASGLAKVNAGDFPPGQTTAENGSFVKLLRNQPGEDPQCGQPQHHPSLVHTYENPGATPPGGARPAD